MTVVVWYEPLIFLRHERGRNEKICRGPVAGDRNVPDHGDAEERFHIRIVRVRLQRVPEENEDVDFAFADLRSNLLVPAQRPALQPLHRKIQLRMEQLSCSPRRDELMPCKRLTIELGPSQEILFLVVMRDDRLGFHHPAVRCRIILPSTI